MRVVCYSVADFLTNLAEEPVKYVLQQTVHISTTYRNLGESSAGLIKQVTVHATAVVELPNGGEYLLDYGEDCGKDYHDGEKDLARTKKAEEISFRIIEACDDVGLKVRPGIIES